MREKRIKLLALAVAALLGMSLLVPSTAQAADVKSSDQKISDSKIKSALSSSNALGNFDAKADERMRRVVKVLRTTDKAQVNQFVPVAFHLENVNPFAVIRFVSRVIEVEEGNYNTFVAPDGNSGLLLVNVPIWQVEPLKELVALIDRPGLTSSSGTARAYIQTNYRSPADPNFISALSSLITVSGTIIPDLATGAFFLEDAPSGVNSVKATMETIDQAGPTVLLNSRIYELDLTNDGTLGLDFHAWKNGPGRNLFAIGGYREYVKVNDDNGSILLDAGIDPSGLPGERFKNHGYGGAYVYEVPSAYFDYLASKGRARILLSPRVAIDNRFTANFSVGEELLYYAVSGGGNLNTDAVDNPDLGNGGRSVVAQVAEIGTDLSLTPYTAEQSISLDVEIDVDSHLGYDGQGAPLVSTRSFDTEMRVNHGQEQVLGGMTRTRSIQTTRKMPILGSIPVLGYFFGGEITTAKKTQLAVMVMADYVDDYSGLTPVEDAVINDVETPGMSQVEVPETLAGFDQYLLD